MKIYEARDFLFALHEIDRLSCRMKTLKAVTPSAAPTDDDFANIETNLKDAEVACAELGLAAAATKINLSRSYFTDSKADVNVSSAETELRNVQEAVLAGMYDYRFILINPVHISALISQTPFGEAVDKAFPSARTDITESINCIAVDCSTAAVFHLMRAAEHALRALAHDRRITVPNGPIELATWDDIIKELEKVEQQIQGYPKTLAREKQFEFYHGAMMEFKRFKNKFRNVVMHTRDSYDTDQANSALTHVKDFMSILATRISEKKRTPLIWVKA